MRGSLLLALILAAACGGAERARPRAQTPVARVDPGLDVLRDPPAADDAPEADTTASSDESADSSDVEITDDAPEVEFDPMPDDSDDDSFIDFEGDEDE